MCSPAVSDGKREAAYACRVMRARHSNTNSEVVSCTGDGLSLGVTRAACCAAQQHVQHYSPRRAAPRCAALLDYVGAVAPGGVKRNVAIAPVIRPALR